MTGDIDCRARPKILRQKADPTNPRCLVGIMGKYLAAIPREGHFYRRPLPNKSGKICFWQQHVGINTLSKYVQTMFSKAGIPWREQHRNISNHSGKAACCTQLYEQGFDEQAITMRSGHRSKRCQGLQAAKSEDAKGHIRHPTATQTYYSNISDHEDRRTCCSNPPGTTTSTTTCQRTTPYPTV